MALEASDDGRPELESPVFTVCTLNVGGRNTNSFEFEMRGDRTALGERWGELYERANAGLAEGGPATCDGLEETIDAAYTTIALEPRSTESVVTSLLAEATWEAALDRVKSESPMLFNACNLASLRVGRPAPLEMPENLLKRLPEEEQGNATAQFFEAWLAWLHSTSSEDWAAWAKRAKKYHVSLGDAVAGLLIFDSMCFEALKRMYPSSSCGSIIREHLAFHDRLHFTTELGKYTKLVELLAELQFPEVVCLQEAHDLVEISRGGTSALSDRMYSMFADKYYINSAGETAVLARRDAFQTVPDDEAKSEWYLKMEAQGQELYGNDPKLLKDWETTLQRTCVVQARRLRTEVSRTASLLPKRWAAVDKMTRRGASFRLRSTPRSGPVPVALCAVHGKGASEIGAAFVPALARALSTHFSDKAAFILGMDSNTADSDTFSAALEGCGILAERASDLKARTVAKRRSKLQTQVKKAGVLDVSLKDFVVAWRADEAGTKMDPLVMGVEQFPSLASGDTIEMLMPTAQWPFDHALLVAEVEPA